MTQDIDKFCSSYCDALPKLMISPFVISYYCWQAYVRFVKFILILLENDGS
jgi:hypothetical protein